MLTKGGSYGAMINLNVKMIYDKRGGGGGRLSLHLTNGGFEPLSDKRGGRDLSHHLINGVFEPPSDKRGV